MSRFYGLIPAAGKGTRARPYSASIPKSMLEINGVPNLQRNVELMRDQLGITDIVIITGYRHEVIEKYFGNGAGFGVAIHYVRNNELDKGLAWSIYLGSQFIDDYFCVILSDECYVDSNHHGLKFSDYREAIVTCVIKEVDDRELIKRNYAVELEGNRIRRLIEKPRQVDNDILGCGTYVCAPTIFPLLKKAFDASPDNYVEFVTFLDGLCRSELPVKAFLLEGAYVNINDRDSLALAKFNDRSHRFTTQKKSLIIYSEGTEETISFTLARYRKISVLDTIYVLVPHENKLEQLVAAHDAAVIRCPPGCSRYGEKIKYALDMAEGDILILTEADYAFPARDIEKLMTYIKEADMVIGTRTTRQLMDQGTDLQGTVRLANVLIAKLLEVLWWHREGRFSDIGCTFRAIWRPAYERIRDNLKAPGPEFSAEMIVELLNQRMRVVEIPVNYHNVSRAMNEKYRNIDTFFRFLRLLFSKRIFGPTDRDK